MKAAGVTAVTLNWNSFDDTRECLESLAASLTYRPLDVVVVDNASTDDSVALLRDWLVKNGLLARVSAYSGGTLATQEVVGASRLPVHLILASTNLGFCTGNNLGIAEAFGAGNPYVLVLNNDTIAEPEMISELVKAAEQTRAGLVGGLICYEGDRDTIWWAGGVFDKSLETKRLLAGQPLSALEFTAPYETQWISGCMTLIPHETSLTVGAYDESFFIWSEEWDLSLRVSEQGRPLVVAPSARLFHKVGRSLGVLYPLSYYYGTRNRLMLKRKHLSPLRRRRSTTIFVVTRVPRYLQLLARGRPDLVAAGIFALSGYFRGVTGKWSRHDRYSRPPAAEPG